MIKKIKLFDPVISDEEKNAVENVLNSGFWASGAGTGNVDKFEKKFKTYVGSKDCIAVNSGTAALDLALSAVNIKNKEVIIPSLSFVSTANSVVSNGGKPIFAEIDPKTLCIDPNDVEKKITKNTCAILPVHFAGMTANLTKINKIKKEHNLTVIEDAAHACGATFNGKKIGTHGNMVCFSFHPVKNLAMPSGGLISINQSNFKNLRKSFSAKRWCGITDRKNVFYDVKEMGSNLYMNEFSAAIGLVQLKKLNRLNNIRKKISKRYDNEINLEQKMPYNKNSVYHFYWIQVKNRNQFRKNMNNVGIETGIHYKPIHTLSMYAKSKHLPITETVGNSIVTLPTHPNLSNSNIDHIINSVNKFGK
jgi:perosamine synthetase